MINQQKYNMALSGIKLCKQGYKETMPFIKCSWIVLFWCICLKGHSQKDASPLLGEEDPKKSYKLWGEIVNGDTVPSIRLQEIYVYGDYIYKNKKQYEAWTRTKYNVKKVYPYAILAAAKLKEYNRILEKMPNESMRKAYMKVVEKELKDQFEDQLKELSMTQGRILLKLIDRETGNTSYELVKDLRGGFQAFMWQSVARIFGSNMKSEYDPKGEDVMIERAIKLIEAGQF